jgi:hypothetical protein
MSCLVSSGTSRHQQHQSHPHSLLVGMLVGMAPLPVTSVLPACVDKALSAVYLSHPPPLLLLALGCATMLEPQYCLLSAKH